METTEVIILYLFVLHKGKLMLLRTGNIKPAHECGIKLGTEKKPFKIPEGQLVLELTHLTTKAMV